MRKLIVLSSLVLAFSLALTLPGAAATVYRPGEGFHSEEEDAGQLEKSASEQLHKAEALEQDGDYRKAIGAYRGVLKGFPGSGVSSKAQFKMAEMMEKAGDLERAFKEYGNYISKYPSGKEFDTVVEHQFNIATAFLNGERRKVFGVKTFSSLEHAQKMFEEIIKNAPYSKYAPLSQFNLGMVHEKRGEYLEAADAYQTAVDKYPNENIAADAQYQIGYVQKCMLEKGSNDHTTRQKAHDAFEDFTVRYPQSEKIAQARENLKELSSTDLKKTLSVAQFYEKTKKFKSAVIYYNQVIKDGKGSPEADTAVKALEHMKEYAGEEAMRSAPEMAETGTKAQERRRMQAQVETASRPDYNGPPAPVPASTPETAPAKPQLRTSADNANLPPAPEPALPSQ